MELHWAGMMECVNVASVTYSRHGRDRPWLAGRTFLSHVHQPCYMFLLRKYYTSFGSYEEVETTTVSYMCNICQLPDPPGPVDQSFSLFLSVSRGSSSSSAWGVEDQASLATCFSHIDEEANDGRGFFTNTHGGCSSPAATGVDPQGLSPICPRHSCGCQRGDHTESLHHRLLSVDEEVTAGFFVGDREGHAFFRGCCG